MRAAPAVVVLGLLAMAGCASAPTTKSTAGKNPLAASPSPQPQNINWEEVDKSTARTREREKKSAWTKTESTQVESGYFPMSDEDYASALASATNEIRQANPKLSESEVETKARERADEARRKYESAHTTRASTSVKWTSPP